MEKCKAEEKRVDTKYNHFSSSYIGYEELAAIPQRKTRKSKEDR